MLLTSSHGNFTFVFVPGKEYGKHSSDLSDYRQEVSLSMFYLSNGLLIASVNYSGEMKAY